MQRFALRDALPLVSTALLMAACGGAPQEGLDSAPEAGSNLGTSQAGLSVGISCSRTSYQDITCTASGSGGVPPYTYFWSEQRNLFVPPRTDIISAGSGPSTTQVFFCWQPDETSPGDYSSRYRVSVKDSTGASAGLALSDFYVCG
ncbi:hypothetical protein JY651_32865 [Pyxidicoccus parkwayensis]|jgi:hypothetical protein|uniref:Ig-like domain-containing protein n=1 Tax=Pyxidicoccus parkwayensis TaxID=2813578 RepID=A0ABX7NRA6_9BACT|nr:hypothetical protein [Pyxidicoccus parkwaysis]QSQ20047.1 hypothetical protein JY651_32865 [Pyxidicoccus parkwaysis]